MGLLHNFIQNIKLRQISVEHLMKKWADTKRRNGLVAKEWEKNDDGVGGSGVIWEVWEHSIERNHRRAISFKPGPMSVPTPHMPVLNWLHCTTKCISEKCKRHFSVVRLALRDVPKQKNKKIMC